MTTRPEPFGPDRIPVRCRTRRILAGLAAAILLISGLWPASAASAPGRRETLVIGVGRDFLDGPASRTYLHGSTHTWEALTYLDGHLNAVPWLAESWEALDNARTWVFHLRPGVRFHDGTVLSADLARKAILRIAASPRYDPSGVYRDLKSLDVRGPLDLVFRLGEPCPAFPNQVSYYSSPILHPDSFEPDGRLKTLTGTGPFRLVRAVPGGDITLDAFKGHWGPAPGFGRVIFRTLTDARTRAMALMAGEVDAVADVGAILPQQVPVLKKIPGLTLGSVEVATTHYLIFNCRKPPFDTLGSRHWLARLTDRKALVNAMAPACGRVATDPYSPLARDWAFGHMDGSWKDSTAPAPAAPVDILILAGTTERWPYLDIAQFLQAQLGSKGFQAAIRVLEPGAYYREMKEGKFNLALQPNTLMTGDPDFFYSYYLASDGPRHYGCGCDAVDQLIRQGRTVPDKAGRREIYRQLSRSFSRDLPLLPLYHEISWFAVTGRVADFGMDHNFRPFLVGARPTPAVRPGEGKRP